MTTPTCSVDGCDRPIRVKMRQLCSMHYHRWQRHGDTTDRTPHIQSVCTVDGCPRMNYGHGLCSMHYHRWKRCGDTAERPARTRSVCVIEGCESFIIGQGWCAKHYTRALRFGDPIARYNGEVVDGKRICPKCKVDLPLDHYNPGHVAGLAVYCKSCTCAVTAAWREANPAYVPPPQDPVKGREWSRLWREANPDQVRAQAALYRARKYHPGAEMFSPTAVFDRDGWICGLCAEPIDHNTLYPNPMSVSLDHIVPLSKGGEHTRANTQAAHLLCNVRKHNTLVT